MIKSWANTRTRQFADTGDPRHFRGLDRDLALERLAVLSAAASLSDIPPLRSYPLHALRGDRKGQWSIAINGPWRLCFRFKEGAAEDVETVDYH